MARRVSATASGCDAAVSTNRLTRSRHNSLAVSIAVEDTRAAVMQYAQEAKLVFPIALDLNSTVKRAYRIFGPPATFFIDGQGTIRDVVIGPITSERAREGLKKAGATL